MSADWEMWQAWQADLADERRAAMMTPGALIYVELHETLPDDRRAKLQAGEHLVPKSTLAAWDWHLDQLTQRLADPTGACPHVGRDNPGHQAHCVWFQIPPEDPDE